MQLYSELSVRSKVALAFGFILLVTGGLGFLSAERLSAVNSVAAEIRDNWLPGVRDLGLTLGHSERYRALEAQLLLVHDNAKLAAEVEKNMEEVRADREAAWKNYERTVSPGDERRLADAIIAGWKEYIAASDKVLALARQNHLDEARALTIGDQRTVYLNYRKAVLDDLELNNKGGQKAVAEGEAIYNGGRLMIFVGIGIATLLGIGAGFSVVFSVSRPILQMTESMGRLAKRELTVQIAGIDRKDEIGQMAAAVEVFKQSMVEADRLVASERVEQKRKEARQMSIESYISDFERSVQDMMEALASASAELKATAESMAATAEETTNQATAVASASEQASGSVQTVAAATEEMAASIAEIGRQAQQSTEIATKAVEEVGRTNTTVQGLSEAAQKIGAVVQLIQNIASQTNLLALNATIEAARAGEAGKGFAVVASEVKTLANQTAKATEEISAQVESMQGSTGNVVAAITAISETIVRVNEISGAIANSVDQQGAATREITRNTQEAAHGTGEVSRNIVSVKQAASEAGSASTQVLASSGQLSQQAEALKIEIDKFLANIRAA